MKLMRVREAAQLLDVKEVTIRRWLGRGELTGSLTPAGWRLTEADIQAFLDKHRVTVDADKD